MRANSILAAKSFAKFSNYMSRIGKLPIPVPSGVTVTLADHDLTLKGPKGELKFTTHGNVTVTQDETGLHVTVKRPDEKFDRALRG